MLKSTYIEEDYILIPKDGKRKYSDDSKLLVSGAADEDYITNL
jgi:hypothetical protein